MPPGAGGGADSMDELYGESDTKPKDGKKSVDDQEKEEMATTAIVPLKMLQGKDDEPPKEGTECTVKIVKVYDDEAEIAWIPKKGGESEEVGETPDSEIDKMDSPGTY